MKPRVAIIGSGVSGLTCAVLFAENGFIVLLHDHRNFGASDGEPRQDVDPWRQIADWRGAISFIERLEVVDSKRILFAERFDHDVLYALGVEVLKPLVVQSCVNRCQRSFE